MTNILDTVALHPTKSQMGNRVLAPIRFIQVFFSEANMMATTQKTLYTNGFLMYPLNVRDRASLISIFLSGMKETC